MYVVVVFFDAKPAHIAELGDALLIQARNSLENERGCHRFDVSADPLDPASFLLYEIYEDEAAFKAHLATPHYTEFAARVASWTASKRVLTYALLSGGGRGGITGREGGHA